MEPVSDLSSIQSKGSYQELFDIDEIVSNRSSLDCFSSGQSDNQPKEVFMNSLCDDDDRNLENYANVVERVSSNSFSSSNSE